MQAHTSQLAYTWAMPGGRPTTKPAPFFGQRMAAFRMAKGLSQAQLGEELAMTRDRIAYYERSATNPSFEVIQKVAEYFGVTVGELLNDTTKARNKPGPPSQFVQLAERLDRLPRAQQKTVAQMLEGFLKQAAS
jgi:transcriptional regulator with XRE-family HTH domain